MYIVAICIENTEEAERIKQLIFDRTKGEDVHISIYTQLEQLRQITTEVHLAILGISDAEDFVYVQELRNKNEDMVLVISREIYTYEPEVFRVGTFRCYLQESSTKHKQMMITEAIDEMKHHEGTKFFCFADKEGIRRVELETVLFIERSNKGSMIYLTDGKKFYTPIELSLIHKELSNRGFEFAHNSYMVNFYRIVICYKTSLVLEGDIHLNIARSKQNNFKQRFRETIKFPIIV